MVYPSRMGIEAMNFVKNGGFTMQIMGIEATNIVVEWGYKGCPQR